MVDDFGIKYVGKQHAQHLSTSLRENYKITEDWTGELYLGIKLKLILLLLVSTDTWQTTKYARVQRLREGLQNGGHCDPLVRKLQQHLVLLLTL